MTLLLCGGGEGTCGEVDLGSGEGVQIVREDVKCDVRDDFDNLGVAESCGARASERRIVNMTARLVDGHGELECRHRVAID